MARTAALDLQSVAPFILGLLLHKLSCQRVFCANLCQRLLLHTDTKFVSMLVPPRNRAGGNTGTSRVL